ncbi:enoyl-CoA hydratase/isomerase family protein [Actinomadura rugatobispora]|uniref:Enoyl-CoA hydratase/isomerase family protein n=1 Tax=Actinomadura rugatobispora TaxID=1994 RepID=A0ABW1AAA2_9ACTN|nr:enoyl-CoA hydratase/isomerase family protein [Actinomadura rugatobispora]
MSTTIATEQDRRVLRITLNVPETRNALSTRMMGELSEAIRGAPGRGTRAVLLTGAGPAFCSGMDLRERSGGKAASGRPLMELVHAIGQVPVPVVAGVRGAARAGGLVLAAACDITVADARATFAMPEPLLGLVPEMTLAVLASRAPSAPLRRHVLTGTVFDAAAALQMGLISQVSPAGTFDQDIAGILDDLNRCSPDAVAATKRRLATALPPLENLLAAADASDAGFTAPHAREGVEAIREGRTPPWLTPPDQGQAP